MATAVLDRIQVPYEVRMVGPFPRILKEAQAGTIDIIAEIKNLPERQPYLGFTTTPLFENPVAAFTRSGGLLAITRWEDMIGHRGGVTAGNRFGDGLDEFISNRLDVEPAERIELNFAKLAAGHIDYFITGYYSRIIYLLGTHQENKFIPQMNFLVRTSNYCGFSKNSPCYALLARYDAALHDLVRDGVIPQLFAVGLENWRRTQIASREPHP